MRKWLIVLLTVLGLSATVQAQDFSIRFGPSLTFTDPVSFGLEARLYATNVTRIAPTVDLGIIANFGLSFGGGEVSGGVAAGPAVVLSFDRNAGFAYFGINLGLAFGGGNTAFIFAFVTGVDYQINQSIGLFADLNLIVVPRVLGGLDMGADFRLSRGVDLYAKITVGFAGTFGLGAGLKFAL